MPNATATAAVIKAASASIVATASTTEVAAVMLEESFAQDCFRTNQAVFLCDHVPVGFDYIVARKILVGVAA